MKYTHKILHLLPVFLALILAFSFPAKAALWQEEALPTIPTSDYMQHTGWAGCMVIPVQFLDESFSENPEETLTEIFIGDGYGIAPSVLTYFQRSSYGIFYTDTVIQFPVTLEGNRREYNSDPARVIDEALTIIGNRGVDIPTFDEDGNGILDGLYLVFAGDEQADTIWRDHTGTMREGLYSNGVYISNYSFLSYAHLTDGSTSGDYAAILATAEQLGLSPDTATAKQDGATADTLFHRSLGDLDPYSKLTLGWLMATEVRESGSYSFPSSSVSGKVIKITDSDADSCYLVEYVTREQNQNPLILPENGGIRCFLVENGSVIPMTEVLEQGNSVELPALHGGSSSFMLSVTAADGQEATMQLSTNPAAVVAETPANTESAQETGTEGDSLSTESISNGSENGEEPLTGSKTASPVDDGADSPEVDETLEAVEGEGSVAAETERTPIITRTESDPTTGIVLLSQEDMAFNGSVTPKKLTAPVGISMLVLFGGCFLLLRNGSGRRKR